MNITYLRSIAGAAVACAAGFYLTTSTFAATVNLDLTVQNGNFEGGLTDWSQCCSGSPGASTYTPTTANYSPLAIPGGGTAAMYVPVSSGNGSGYVVQDLGIGFTSGTTYTVDVYVAMPLITNDAGLANHLDQTVITAELVVDNGGGLSIPGTLTENVSYVNAAPSALLPTGITSLGTWELITLSATATGTITGDIGLELGASMNDIDQPHQVDFVVGATPLPSAVWLFGSVLLGGLGLLSSRKRRLHVPVSMMA